MTGMYRSKRVSPLKADMDLWNLGSAPKMTADYFGQAHNARHGDVRTWQAQMARRGWSLAVDQHYGPASERVCRLFQGEKGLGVDRDLSQAIHWYRRARDGAHEAAATALKRLGKP